MQVLCVICGYKKDEIQSLTVPVQCKNCKEGVKLKMAVSLVAQSKTSIFKILKWRLSTNSPKQNIREAKQNKILLCHSMALLRRAV